MTMQPQNDPEHPEPRNLQVMLNESTRFSQFLFAGWKRVDGGWRAAVFFPIQPPQPLPLLRVLVHVLDIEQECNRPGSAYDMMLVGKIEAACTALLMSAAEVYS